MYSRYILLRDIDHVAGDDDEDLELGVSNVPQIRYLPRVWFCTVFASYFPRYNIPALTSSNFPSRLTVVVAIGVGD